MKNNTYDKILTRLLLIIKKLSLDERPKPQDLADEFGVGIRTIQNDLYKRLHLIIDIEKDELGRLKLAESCQANIYKSICKDAA